MACTTLHIQWKQQQQSTENESGTQKQCEPYAERYELEMTYYELKLSENSQEYTHTHTQVERKMYIGD
jgi:phage tail tube protein FII